MSNDNAWFICHVGLFLFCMGIVSIRYSQNKIYKRLSLLWKFNSIFVVYSHADVIYMADGWENMTYEKRLLDVLFLLLYSKILRGIILQVINRMLRE